MKQRHARHDLVDYEQSGPDHRFQFDEKLRFGGVTLTRGELNPNPGAYLGTAQVTVVIHEGSRFRIEWRAPGSDKTQSNIVSRGCAHVADARIPFWQRWNGFPSIFAFAMDESFVAQVWQTAFDGVGDRAIETSIDVDDPVAKHLCDLGQRELSLGGAGGRLYVEGLATSLAVHLIRTHGTSQRMPASYRGGLTPTQLRRVVEFVNVHLNDELGLAELAVVADLSPHHFGEAFKTSVGTSPHRYVMERRIHRARELLSDARRPIAEIAHAAGFSSQAHLTTNFRRAIGVTPGRFRRLLG
ncbi:MAG TPA: AraC family transcriptional regulator [Rhizomicrobium sp.]